LTKRLKIPGNISSSGAVRTGFPPAGQTLRCRPGCTSLHRRYLTKSARHRAMYSSNAVVGKNMGMEDRDITETDNPFGLLAELFEIDGIDDTRQAISSPGTEYRRHLII